MRRRPSQPSRPADHFHGALISWAAYAVGNSRWLGRLDDVSVHDWTLLTGIMTDARALILLPAALAPDGLHHDSVDWMRLATVSLGVAMLASIAGNALWNRMSRLLPLTPVGQMILCATLFVLLHGSAWEQRLPTPMEILAFARLVVSVTTCLAAHRQRRAQALATANRHPRD